MATKSFGAWLELQIFGAGLTRQQFAKKMRVHEATIGNWIAGKSVPYDKNLLALAKVFKMDATKIKGML